MRERYISYFVLKLTEKFTINCLRRCILAVAQVFIDVYRVQELSKDADLWHFSVDSAWSGVVLFY